ncbi:putative reductive dehalogenase [Thermovirga lienii DSM 17291]|uniref:Putative reductive dehalogenase n=1 Tax=Thermovirga lienii (strain ATCC BAA-1197 / DSM 17291 / Cas60314) TaxID=580340 RepID=G7V6T2_THELD|nr:4Fe-4S dicluster domain-containing protein [Thermovirga lienii]AER66041.1 putative reductive dehalogenase [Thermovirga lienii DSM 17291]
MKKQERLDERDTMFARMAWRKGGKAYQDYYQRNPEKKEIDEELRLLPDLGSPRTPSWNPLAAPIIDGVFGLLANWHPLVDGEPAPEKIQNSPETWTKWVKGLCLHFGADLVGIVKMEPRHYYSHRGRKEEVYGEPIVDMLPWGVVIARAMDPEMIHRGPLAPQTVETVRGYLNVAVTALALASSIRQAGYKARVHMDGNYLLPLVPAAVDAGLGALGRNGLLITKEFGPCVRISAVTTDMPLLETPKDPIFEKVPGFCNGCNLCSTMCPGKAIPSGPMNKMKDHWSFSPEKCYRVWRNVGTDCGVCISSCPFTQGAVDWKKLVEAEPTEKYAQDVTALCQKRPFNPIPPEWLKGE